VFGMGSDLGGLTGLPRDGVVWLFQAFGDYDVSSRFRGGRGEESRDLLVEDPRLEGFEERIVVVKSDMI